MVAKCRATSMIVSHLKTTEKQLLGANGACMQNLLLTALHLPFAFP